MDDRRADVPAGQRRRLVARGTDLLIPLRVVERAGQVGGQARFGEQRLGEGAAARSPAVSSAAPGSRRSRC
jgi:hypothetical protein